MKNPKIKISFLCLMMALCLVGCGEKHVEEYDFTNYVGGITDGMNVAADEGDVIYKASLESTYNLLEQIEVFLSEENTMYENYVADFEFCGIHLGDPIEKADIFGEPALENHHQGADDYERMYNVYGENGNNENGESHIYKIDLYTGLGRMVEEIP